MASIDDTNLDDAYERWRKMAREEEKAANKYAVEKFNTPTADLVRKDYVPLPVKFIGHDYDTNQRTRDNITEEQVAFLRSAAMKANDNEMRKVAKLCDWYRLPEKRANIAIPKPYVAALKKEREATIPVLEQAIVRLQEAALLSMKRQLTAMPECKYGGTVKLQWNSVGECRWNCTHCDPGFGKIQK